MCKKWDIGEVCFSSKLCFIYVFCSTSNGNQGLIHKMPTCSNNIRWRYFLLRKLILGKLMANQVTRDISHDFYFVLNFSFGYNDLFSYTDLIQLSGLLYFYSKSLNTWPTLCIRHNETVPNLLNIILKVQI